MGVVTSATGCERFRGLLAEDALGGLDDGSRAVLQTHLDVCSGCRADAAELSETVGALAWVGPALAEELARPDTPVSDAVPTGDLDAAVAEILARDGSTDADTAGDADARGTHRPAPAPVSARRGRGRRVLAPVLAVAAVALLVVGSLGLAGHGSPATRTVALSGPGGGRATAVLTSESWGTSVRLTTPGGQANRVLTVSMTTEYGRSWNAGSYRAVASHGVTVTLACALPVDQIRTIAVTDAGGQVVLTGNRTGG